MSYGYAHLNDHAHICISDTYLTFLRNLCNKPSLAYTNLNPAISLSLSYVSITVGEEVF